MIVNLLREETFPAERGMDYSTCLMDVIKPLTFFCCFLTCEMGMIKTPPSLQSCEGPDEPSLIFLDHSPALQTWQES